MTAQPIPHFHPRGVWLLRHAAGRLSPAMHLLLAAHSELCPACRHAQQACEAEAGLALENLPPEKMEEGCLKNLLSRIDEAGPPACIDVTLPAPQCTLAQHHLPQVLAPHAGMKGERIAWDYSRGFACWVVPLAGAQAQATLYCLDENALVDANLLGARALVLVLAGSLQGKGRTLSQGDVLEAAHMGRTLRAGPNTLCLVAKPGQGDSPGWLGSFFKR